MIAGDCRVAQHDADGAPGAGVSIITNNPSGANICYYYDTRMTDDSDADVDAAYFNTLIQNACP
jgi:hypothetical protein